MQSPITGDLLYPPTSGHWRLGEERMWAALNEWAPYKRVLLDDIEKRAEICDLSTGDMRAVEAMVLDVDLEIAQGLAQVKQTGVLPEVYFINEGSLIQVKGYKPEGLVPRTFWPFNVVGSNRNSKAETKKLFPGVTPFDTPKPERLIQRIIHLATDPGDIVLDCFGGSGTTAAVAHKMGRRWVTSELLPNNVATYVKPRLSKVVEGDDPGGVTVIKERVAADGVAFPVGLDPEEAQRFQRVLRKVLRAPGEIAVDDLDATEDELNEGEQADEGIVESAAEPEPLTISLSSELQKVLRAATKTGASPLDSAEQKVLHALLRKIDHTEIATVDITKSVRAEILKRTKTTDKATVLWHGGGGFTHLEVGPSMFEDVDGVIVLADWATQGELTKAMCAQLELRYAPNGIFASAKGNVRYVVIDGLVGEGTVASILEQTPLDDIVQVWATQYEDAADAKLRLERPGSRLEMIPDSVLDSYWKKSANGSPFKRQRAEPTHVASERKLDVSA